MSPAVQTGNNAAQQVTAHPPTQNNGNGERSSNSIAQRP